MSTKKNILPLVVVRSPYEFHCSGTQQRIKRGFDTGTSLVKFSSQIDKIKKIKTIFPNTEFIPFNKLREHSSGPCGYLYEKIGVNSDGFSIIKANEGVSNALVRSQALLNRTSPRIIDGKVNRDYQSICFLGREHFQSKFLLTQEEMMRIKDELDKENDFFIKNLGESFKDKSIEFSDHFSVYLELANYLSNEKRLKSQDGFHLRNAALKLETIDLNLSFHFMKLAHEMRPNGLLLRKK